MFVQSGWRGYADLLHYPFYFVLKFYIVKKKSIATNKMFNPNKPPNRITNDNKRKYTKEQI